MKNYVVVNKTGVVGEYGYEDKTDARDEIIEIIKRELVKRNRIDESYAVVEIDGDAERDVFVFEALISAANEMQDNFESVGIMREGNKILVYGKEHEETGEDKDIYFIEKDGEGFVRE